MRTFLAKDAAAARVRASDALRLKSIGMVLVLAVALVGGIVRYNDAGESSGEARQNVQYTARERARQGRLYIF